jgi:predicted amidohydrolase
VAQRPGRQVWIASLTLEGIQSTSREATLRQMLARMEQLSGTRPDLICLPEAFNGRYTPRPTPRAQAEPLDGPTITAVAAFAQSKRCYVVAPITLDRGGALFNTAVLLDRAGKVAGTYDKIHPTENEMQGGITPGRAGAQVFTTDFGKLGVQICFDIDWPDGWQSLKDQGAELVVWPAAYPGGFPLNALAWTHRYPIVTSPWTTPAALIDVDGRTLEQSGTWEPWISTALHLDRGLFHLDFHLTKLRELEKTHGRDVSVRWSHDENAFVLENRIPGKSLAELAKEFGLLPMDAYLARAKSAQDRARG